MVQVKHDADSATKEELEAASETLDSIQKGDFYAKHEAAVRWIKQQSQQSQQARKLVILPKGERW